MYSIAGSTQTLLRQGRRWHLSVLPTLVLVRSANDAGAATAAQSGRTKGTALFLSVLPTPLRGYCCAVRQNERQLPYGSRKTKGEGSPLHFSGIMSKRKKQAGDREGRPYISVE